MSEPQMVVIKLSDIDFDRRGRPQYDCMCEQCAEANKILLDISGNTSLANGHCYICSDCAKHLIVELQTKLGELEK